MAERKTTATKEVAEAASAVEQIQELNLDAKVTVKSIAGWNVGFSRIDGFGDITFAPHGSNRLSRTEIIAQVQNGNKLFTGVDGTGGHATLYIDDTPTRVEVEFESADGKKMQDIFTDAKVKNLFSITGSKFEDEFKKAICTRAEKYAVIAAIKRLNINDFKKLKFVENYTGYKIQ